MADSDTLCGLRPTGDLHLGHYFAVVKPALAGADVLIADLHAPDPDYRTKNHLITNLQRTLMGFQIEARHIYLQSDMFDSDWFFKLMSLAPLGELKRMTQFKVSTTPNAHLLTYPVLMTLDVAGYKYVVVGDDQKQHLEFAQTLLRRYNRVYGANTTIPEALPTAGRIRSLTKPDRKMSKSEPSGCLFLEDPPDVIATKIRRAVTNEAGLANLRSLYTLFECPEPMPETSNLALKSILTGRIISVLKELHGS
jgi:tryptophanyl-tRNA synthetase